jgi:hypothetical protein
MNGIILPLTPKRRDIIVRDRFGFLIRSFIQYRYASIDIHDWHVQSVVKDRDGTRLSGAFRKEPQNSRFTANRKVAEPCVLETFPTYRCGATLSTGRSHSFHTGISTAKWSRMFEMHSQIGLGPEVNGLKGSFLSADSNMRPSNRAETPGLLAKQIANCGHAPSRKSENLSKDQFGVLAKGTLRKLYSRIFALANPGSVAGAD